MWVRSQDKTKLIDIKAIYWGKEAYARFYKVYTKDLLHDATGDIELGLYETRETAMKVLDDLQCMIVQGESGVFQMPPKEDE